MKTFKLLFFTICLLFSNLNYSQKNGFYNVSYDVENSKINGAILYKCEINSKKDYIRLYFKVTNKNSTFQIYNTSIIENEEGKKLKITNSENITIVNPGSNFFSPIENEFYLEFNSNYYITGGFTSFKTLNFYENKDKVANSSGWFIKNIKLLDFVELEDLFYFDKFYSYKKEYKKYDKNIYECINLKENNLLILQNGGYKLLFFKNDIEKTEIDIRNDNNLDNFFIYLYYFVIKDNQILISLEKKNQINDSFKKEKIKKYLIINLNDYSYKIEKFNDDALNMFKNFDESKFYIKKFETYLGVKDGYSEDNNNIYANTNYRLKVDSDSIYLEKFSKEKSDLRQIITQYTNLNKKNEFIKNYPNSKYLSFIKNLTLNEVTDLYELKSIYLSDYNNRNQIDTKAFELSKDKNGYLKYLELFPNGNFELIVKNKLNEILNEEKKREYYKDQIAAYYKLGSKLSGEIISKISPNTGRNGKYFFENENDYDNNERPLRIEWTAARCGLCPNEQFIVWGRINVNSGQFILTGQNDAVKMAKDFYKAVDNLFQSAENAISPIAKYVGDYIPDDWASNNQNASSNSKVNIKHDYDNSGLFERLYTEYFIYNCNNEEIKIYRYYKRKEDDGNGPNKWYVKSNTGEELYDTFQQAQKKTLELLNCK